MESTNSYQLRPRSLRSNFGLKQNLTAARKLAFSRHLLRGKARANASKINKTKWTKSPEGVTRRSGMQTG